MLDGNIHGIFPQTMSTRVVKLFYYCRLLAQTSLRNILGTKNLHEILSDRESISIAMQVLFRILIIRYFQFLTIILFLFSPRESLMRPQLPGV